MRDRKCSSFKEKERAEHEILQEEEFYGVKLTDPGLGSGTFPVYSLHFESCTSMYGPSKAFCTSEKAYWQIADALIFFLKDNPPPRPRRHIQRTHSGLMIQCWTNTVRLLSGEQLPPRSNFKHITDHKRRMTGEKVTTLLRALLYSLKTGGVQVVKFTLPFFSWILSICLEWTCGSGVTDRCIISPVFNSSSYSHHPLQKEIFVLHIF